MILIDETHLEIRKSYTQAELEPLFEAAGGKITSYSPGVSKSTADTVKRILENKINAMGTKDAKVNTLTGFNNVARYIRVELAGVDMKQAQEIVGKQGKFEIRVQTTGNDTEHVVSGDAITSVQLPSQEPPGSDKWGVSFTLSEDGATAFQDAAIKYGATADPEQPLTSSCSLTTRPSILHPCPEILPDNCRPRKSGSCLHRPEPENIGSNQASELEIHLRAGALPVDVSIAGSGGTSAPLGERYKTMAVLAGILALITVGFVIYYRYREPGIVLPMVLINASELVILLGFIALITLPDGPADDRRSHCGRRDRDRPARDHHR